VERLESDLTGQLIALVAHDLRNPLSALHSNISYVASRLDIRDPERQEALEDAAVSCETLAHIIDNLDVVSQFLLGKRQASRIRVSAAGVVTEVVGNCERIARSHGSQIQVSPEALATDVHVRSNREMLERSLTNLVCNAVQHGGGETIHVGMRVDKLECLFTVSDRGSPIAEDLRDSAFSARGQVAAKSISGGRYSRGLGLFVATITAEAAGARIRATEDGNGNVFTLFVPLD
jgi:signal transduction histidine kinase